jgi:hypothetical protein
MEWLTSNIFFLVILLLCIGMHLFGHGDSDRRDRDAQRSTRTNPHRHH